MGKRGHVSISYLGSYEDFMGLRQGLVFNKFGLLGLRL